jgi:hypothetical protein
MMEMGHHWLPHILDNLLITPLDGMLVHRKLPPQKQVG